MSGTHSQLSPSKSAIWGFCYGALAYALRSGIKPGPSNIHSASGTLTHQIAECFLRVHAGGNDGADVHEAEGYAIGTKRTVDGFEFTIDEERLERVETYVRAVQSRGGEQQYEVTLNLDPVLLTDGETGTADALVLDYESATIEVHDLKDGNGLVLADDNDQLILYMLGAWLENELLASWQKFRGFIHQPKLHREPFMVEYTAEQMMGHMKRLRYAASRNIELLHPHMTMPKIISALNPSDKACKWCPMADNGCLARAKQISEQFPDTSVPASQLTPEDIARFLTAEVAISEWFGKLRGEALALAKQGTTIPGFKLAQGREGPRKWIDANVAEEAMYEAIETAIWKKTLISPTDAQKKLKKFPAVWEALQSNIARSEGAITLVPEADSRAQLPLDVPEFQSVTESGDDLL